ncbi:MAG: efflux RND transporter permease subunit [Phocaeicola sp.]|nr:efflux RND transporter permease subunit [Phocaeicola sp.]MDD7449062.1 efflux RND transporter permease subunit [Prevotellaceae bacterium]MDY5939127.1 efflux RND transporter permease subunit [Phocaeicola sp.]
MNWGVWALKNKRLVYFLLLMLTLGGVTAYMSMSKLEDPEIKVKQAAIVTTYPGASSHEVELEVTDKLEKSIRSLAAVKTVKSSSMADVSVITVELSELLSNKEVDQAFDLLRRKVYDVQGALPTGAQESVILDGMGDVFGLFYAFQYEGYSNEEAVQYAELIQREVKGIKGVSQVVIYGKQAQTINIDLNEEKLANLGIMPMQVLQLIQGQNAIIYSGYYDVGGQRMRVSVSNRYKTVEDISDLIIQGTQGDQIRLGDIAHISEGYANPQRSGMRFDGKQALGIAISANSGTDITKVGKAVEELIQRIEIERLPAGMKMHKVFFQSDRVKDSLNSFIINLIESVLIVVFILIFFMGWRSGVILGIGLFVTVMGSILLLNTFNGTLQRVSLMAFILAMGMLVDNAIVVLDGIQINLEKGMERSRALTEPGMQTAMPLLGATLIAILSFLPIFLSPDTAGIYVRDLFIVLAVSLMLSWILALVMNPILADKMMHPKKLKSEGEAYTGRFYDTLERVVKWVLHHRWVSVGSVAIVVLISLWGYRLLPQGFFPDMDYNQLYIEYKLPEGYTTQRVDHDLKEIEDYLRGRKEIDHVTTAIGGTPARYNLVRSITGSSLSYGELIVDFYTPKDAVENLDEIQAYLTERYPDAQVRVKRYNLMYKEYPIELEFRGPDPAVLRNLAEQAVDIIQKDPKTLMVRSNWFPRVPALQIDYNQPKALRAGLSRRDIGLSLLTATYGLPMGTFYDGAEPKTITIRTVNQEGQPLDALDNAAIFSMLPSINKLDRKTLEGLLTGAVTKEDIISSLLQSKPLSSVTDGVQLIWEEPIIMRTDGERSIKAQCVPITGVSNETLRSSIAPALENIALPEGYSMKWEGEYGASEEATTYLFMYYPVAIILMIGILIMLFGDYKKPIVIILCLPTLAIGVVWGMYISGKTFSFTAIVAVLGLIGMMIKNIIVLLDEVTLLTSQGIDEYHALVSSAKSRVRPVMLASATTILGMLPLLTDALFGPTAVVIMAGLIVATVMTIIFAPLVYALLYKVRIPEEN